MKSQQPSQQLWVDEISQKCYLIKTKQLTSISPSSIEIKQVKSNGDNPVTWHAKDFGQKPRELSAEQKIEIKKVRPMYRPASAKLDGYFQMPSSSVLPYQNLQSKLTSVNLRNKLYKATQESVKKLQHCASTENVQYICSMAPEQNSFALRHLSAATNHEEIRKIRKVNMNLVIQNFDAYIDRDDIKQCGTAREKQQRILDLKPDIRQNIPNSTIHDYKLTKTDFLNSKDPAQKTSVIPKSDLDLMLKSTRPGTANRCEVLRQTTPFTTSDEIQLFTSHKLKRLQSACPGRGLNQNTFACYKDFKLAEQTEEERIPNYSIKKQHKMVSFFSCKHQQLVTTKLALKSPPLSPKQPPKQEEVKQQVAKQGKQAAVDNKKKTIATVKPALVALVVKDNKPKEKTLQKTVWVCKENIEDTPEDGDQPWATDNGLQIKPFALLQHENLSKNPTDASVPQRKLFRCTTKNKFVVEIMNNKGHRLNDLEILRCSNPSVFERRDLEVCRELAGKVASKRQKLLLQQMQEKQMRKAEKLTKLKAMQAMQLF